MTETRIYPLLAAGAGLWLIYLLAPILTPFVASALLAYLGDPLVDRLEKLKLSRTLAVIVAFVFIFFGIGALTLLIVPLVRDQGAAFAAVLPVYVDKVGAEYLPRIMEYMGLEAGEFKFGVSDILSEYGDKIATLASGALGTVTRSGGALLTMVLTAFLIPILTFYLLRDWDILVEHVGELVPASMRDSVFTLARESDQALGGFLRGQMLVMLGLATIYGIGLSIVGLDYALAIGVVAGLVSFVPYLGLIVGIVLAGLSALAQPLGLGGLVGVVAVFVVGQLIEGMLLTPKLVGDRIGLHPVLVIFAVMAGGQLFGFFGILLALPGAAVASVVVRHLYAHFEAQAGPEEFDELLEAVIHEDDGLATDDGPDEIADQAPTAKLARTQDEPRDEPSAEG